MGNGAHGAHCHSHTAVELSVFGAWEEPADRGRAHALDSDVERPGGENGTELAGVGDARAVVSVVIVAVETVEAGAVESGVEGMVGHVRQWPTGSMAGERTGHWTAVSKEQDVGGLKQNLVQRAGRAHDDGCLSARDVISDRDCRCGFVIGRLRAMKATV